MNTLKYEKQNKENIFLYIQFKLLWWLMTYVIILGTIYEAVGNKLESLANSNWIFFVVLNLWGNAPICYLLTKYILDLKEVSNQ